MSTEDEMTPATRALQLFFPQNESLTRAQQAVAEPFFQLAAEAVGARNLLPDDTPERRVLLANLFAVRQAAVQAVIEFEHGLREQVPWRPDDVVRDRTSPGKHLKVVCDGGGDTVECVQVVLDEEGCARNGEPVQVRREDLNLEYRAP